jgi:hypothetical protein
VKRATSASSWSAIAERVAADATTSSTWALTSAVLNDDFRHRVIILDPRTGVR